MEMTAADLEVLKRMYKQAFDEGMEQFVYKGHPFLVSYVKYLIEYLETKFEKKS